ncbi:MAG: hypothetical protein J5J06_20175 [Phycisphaerae bacterium]|nr:hypothetical protein [Phycisphaerae bacterium]
MKLGILTSIDTRHRYSARALCEQLPVVAVAYEETGYSPADVRLDELTERERAIVKEHFAERGRQEERYFGHNATFLEDGGGCAARRLSPGTLNSPETLRFLEEAGVDTVVVYGTNLVRPPLLGRWPGRMINLHLGLSPYYRGTATNFYPLLNEEPEYVGATVHLLDAGIDSGPILRHARPEIVAGDRPHTIGCKAILAGIEAMIGVLRELDAGRIEPVTPWAVANPRLYLRKDYHPRQVVELYRKLDAGLIERYVERAEEVAPRVKWVP